MKDYLENVISSMGITDVLDILIVAFIVYKLIQFIKETRAQQLAKGLLMFMGATVVSKWFNLYTLHWILSETMTVGMIAIVIIFQPEIRRVLENIGRSNFVSVMKNIDKEEATHIIGEFCDALESMSASRTGALIVFERETQLTDIIETGTVIDAGISDQMIGNIFYEGAPLHDGAMIVRGDRLCAAGCVLPLTQNKSLGKELGTRHRAGIGITENSDAVALIVSEETGVISMAQDGKLTRFLDRKKIANVLYNMYVPKESANPVKKTLKRAIKGVKNDKE